MKNDKGYHSKEKYGKPKIVLIIGIILVLIFFIIFAYKKFFTGNNIDRTTQGITNYILNISSYEAKIKITIESNKNKNQYILNQKYTNEDNVFKQEVIEPSNIKGLTVIYNGENLKIENTKLNLSEIYEQYEYISENSLCLYNFIEDYRASEQSKVEETDKQIIMNTKTKNESNKYMMYKTLYIDKESLKPTKMEIKDINRNTLIYIEYNEIEIDSTNKGEILAFNTNDIDV